MLRKLVRDSVLLGIVWRDNIDATFGKALLRYAWNLSVDLFTLCKLSHAQVCHISSRLHFFKIDEGIAFELFLPILHVNEKKRP